VNDITAPDHVEVLVSPDGNLIWVNVDGECALRCCRVKRTITVSYPPDDTVLFRMRGRAVGVIMAVGALLLSAALGAAFAVKL
jgi:hypothetical protein